jgi:hypothetical protein
MAKRLWGDYFYDSKCKRWSRQSKSKDGRKLVRGFCKFILEPLCSTINLISSGQKEKIEKMLQSRGIVLAQKDLDNVKRPKDMMKLILGTW